ncbi:hypothetical protein JTB14_024140 [Gonioctena quinquepunctata]|nr:hypothetical protein JTB14_024140 [Gonioctena quinquepunctata]
MDSKEEARLLKIFEELEQEDSLYMQNHIPEEVLDDEDYVEKELHHDTNSQVSADGSDDPNFRRWSKDGPNNVGKDGQTPWKIHDNVKYSRTKTQNLITKLAGVKPRAKNARSVCETWNMIITDQMIEDIVTFTNIYLQRIRNKYSRRRDVLDTDFDEIRAMFGILYMAGVLESNHTSLADLWNTDSTAPEFFRMVMSKDRFYLLLRALRFDDLRTKVERKKWDKLAPIRQVFDMFQGILPIEEENNNPTVPQGRPKCTYCPKKKNRKTSVKCAKCQKPICKEHTVTYSLIVFNLIRSKDYKNNTFHCFFV